MTAKSLDKLSKSVQQAASEIKKLRRENQRLQEKAVRLEQRLEAGAKPSPEASAWSEERDQVKQRLETLVEHLEGALAES